MSAVIFPTPVETLISFIIYCSYSFKKSFILFSSIIWDGTIIVDKDGKNDCFVPGISLIQQSIIFIHGQNSNRFRFIFFCFSGSVTHTAFILPSFVIGLHTRSTASLASFLSNTHLLFLLLFFLYPVNDSSIEHDLYLSIG